MLRRQVELAGIIGTWPGGLIHRDEILEEEEDPGFVRGMQTRDRGVK
jgi:hypothetical protein